MSRYLSFKFLIPVALFLAVAPIFPRPHLFEKLSMLFSGTLTRPMDIFDLFWHSWPLALIFAKIIMDRRTK